MHVIDIDPQLLQRSAEAAAHAAEQTTLHMEGEIKCLDTNGVEELLGTLTPEGPYAYAIMPQVGPDGRVSLPIETTRAGITTWYHLIRGHSNVLSFEPLVELRAAWYTFQEGVARARVIETQATQETETIILFPVTSGNGITGELCWWRVDPRELGTSREHTGEATTSGLDLRRAALAHHDAYVQAFRAANVDGVLAVLNDDVQAAVRDYVDDTGTLVGLDGIAAHRDYYERLFDTYEIRDVTLLERLAQEWYLFAELRVTVSPRRGKDAGSIRAFHTAEFFIPAVDGRFIARIGHGTDMAPAHVDEHPS